MPADLFELEKFQCKICRGTKDTRCPDCSDWPKAQAKFGAKLIDATKQLDEFIDAEVDKKIAAN
eukprot:COSAG04_NODE_157_length_22270_cov_26.745298_10_plen_64_part_00